MNETSYTAKEYFIKFRNETGFEKSDKYLKWLKLDNPGKEPHHILGSTIGRKFTDYLIVMVDRPEHETAEKFKPYYFMIYLPKAINNLINYVKFLEAK